MKECGYRSLRSLALKMGLTPAALCSYNQGYRFPREKSIQKLAIAFRTDPREIEQLREEVDARQRKKYVTESELEQLVESRKVIELDSMANKVAIQLQPLYEKIDLKIEQLIEITKMVNSQLIGYNTLIEAHNALINFFGRESK